MPLIDKIGNLNALLNVLNATQSEKLKKAFAQRITLEPSQTWEDVDINMIKQNIVDFIKAIVKDIDEKEAGVTYTDMDD